MDAIAELEQRIMAALARIGTGVERQMELAATPSAPVGPSPEVMAELDRLRETLDEERMANAQLTERMKAQRERAERVAVALKLECDRLAKQVDDQALAMQALEVAMGHLREELRRLRAAAGARLDPAQLDTVMAAELRASDALRAAEAADLSDLIAALTPIVQSEEARVHGRA